MGLVLNPSKVESWGKNSQSKGRKKKDEAVEEPGCWVKLRFGTCMPSRSKVNSSITGTSVSYETKSSNEKSRDREVTRGGSSTTTSNAGSCTSTPYFSEELKVASQLRKFTFNELKLATRNFRPESLLGEGGFGCVFKGWVEENGTAPVKPGTGLTVAVKTLNHDGIQGHKEWLAEIYFLGDLIHPNLVKLIGYSIEDDQRLLVYEFLPRGSLENHLFRRSLPLPWSIRMRIALGAAKGLAFLHEEVQKPVIYRDFKTSNILLDADYNAKLSDFGLAKDGPEGDKTHVSTRVMGTYGYAAPEYVMTGHLTSKSDVYSFGVVLLEMINGRRSVDKNRPNGEHNLVEWARQRFGDKKRLFELIDPRLEGHFSIKPARPSPIHETPDPTPTPQPPTFYSGLGPTMPGDKPRVVVLGSGWAGCRLMKGLDTERYDIVCVSPRNHMVFTPLLASTCVGTLEFRSVAEPIARIQPAISRETGSYFFLSSCIGLDPDKHVVKCETVTDGAEPLKPWKFEIAYDKLVIALGAMPTTFGIQGVHEHAIFLREVSHAQEIRRKLLLNLMLSDVPGVSEEEKSRLLHCVVVGGGPTGVEFSGELSDFIQRDVQERYAHVKNYIHVTLIEANEILSSFDDRLRHYATKQLTKSGVRLVRGIVKDVKDKKIILNDGTEVPYGLLVWSTGVGPSPLVNSLPLTKSPGGRIGVDEWLRVPDVQDVYSIGDCSGFVESTGKPTLPALAQVAERQGKYLASLLNKIGKAGGGRANAAKEYKYEEQFVYKHLGSMATLGRYKALVDLRQSKAGKGVSMAGFFSWFVWRSAYLTRVISWRNRFYVAINWLTTFVFGRDISRI